MVEMETGDVIVVAGGRWSCPDEMNVSVCEVKAGEV
jgi:hypothetical protein